MQCEDPSIDPLGASFREGARSPVVGFGALEVFKKEIEPTQLEEEEAVVRMRVYERLQDGDRRGGRRKNRCAWVRRSGDSCSAAQLLRLEPAGASVA